MSLSDCPTAYERSLLVRPASPSPPLSRRAAACPTSAQASRSGDTVTVTVTLPCQAARLAPSRVPTFTITGPGAKYPVTFRSLGSSGSATATVAGLARGGPVGPGAGFKMNLSSLPPPRSTVRTLLPGRAQVTVLSTPVLSFRDGPTEPGPTVPEHWNPDQLAGLSGQTAAGFCC